jgi:hypothetical protein
MRKENRVVLDNDDEKQVGNEPQAGIDWHNCWKKGFSHGYVDCSTS